MIYLDNSATTKVCDAAKDVILKHIDDFGNPSSVHELGRQSRILIEDARDRIAKCINAEPDEIYFTSGGSEANTWALHMKRSIAPAFEHHSIKPTITAYVNEQGFAYPEAFDLNGYPGMCAIDIMSCMAVNNELGTIQPISEIAHVAHRRKELLPKSIISCSIPMPYRL